MRTSVSQFREEVLRKPNLLGRIGTRRTTLHLLAAAGLAATLGLAGCEGEGFSPTEGASEGTSVESSQEMLCAIPPPCPDGTGYCESAVWPGGIVYYRFTNPTHSEVQYVQKVMDDWTAGTINRVVFREDKHNEMPASEVLTITAVDRGSGGFSRVGPGADAMLNGGIAYHELGHAIGLPHGFERRDRNHYASINHTAYYDQPAVPGNEEPVRCSTYARCPDADGDFGPHDFMGIMTYDHVTYPDITRWDYTPLTQGGMNCGDVGTGVVREPLWFTPSCSPADCGQPFSPTDAAKLVEIYSYGSGKWDKFRRAHNESEVPARQPFPSVITGTVKIVGSPAVAKMANDSAKLRIFVRGSDDRLYYKRLTAYGTPPTWSGWTALTNGTFTSDPAVVSWGAGRMDLVARGQDNNIWLRSYVNGSWGGGYDNIGSPSGGAASAPAITSWGSGRLDVFVRGTDNKLYTRTCSTTGTNCSAASGNWGTWKQVSSTATFRGKPAANAGRGTGTIDVFVHGMDARLWGVQYVGGNWLGFYQLGLGGTLAWHQYEARSGSCTSDDCYSPAVVGRSTGLDIVIRGADAKAWLASYNNGGSWVGYTPLGGKLTSSPALPTKALNPARIDLVVTMDEERDLNQFVPTLWWKQFPKP